MLDKCIFCIYNSTCQTNSPKGRYPEMEDTKKFIQNYKGVQKNKREKKEDSYFLISKFITKLQKSKQYNTGMKINL